ncbi:MAG TPA: hypothetical protein VMB50_05255, partial [Myxococcales bacterium]|nr:hypothetical protein [Myxococcales bacterium]
MNRLLPSTLIVAALAACGGGGGGGSSGGGTTGGNHSANTIALVDNDGYVGDGSGTDATVLAAYHAFLAGAGITAFDDIAIASNGSQSWGAAATPSASQLAQYKAVIWFTADNSLGESAAGQGDVTMSSDQEANLAGWLASGGKTLVVISEYLLASFDWATAPTDPLFVKYLPLQGGLDQLDTVSGGGCVPINNAPFTVAGGAAVSTAFGALQWTIG